ncbi:MAG: succinate dehydrogenase/fumarate reductase iron-sulfur subunit [Candidatus Thalassarchaeaceae archaeon]|nr:succinate dehydrogenase/fumarate reductase iron-sulfur subunit [Candidatus Thalassarchaeaceae archaeon]MDP7003584.1 succinate dehydrogenase/fumarate reductase iron-sulfur subunit [Candidatus Thalassarchaeaceae archaeon]
MNDQVTFRVFRGQPDADGDPFGQMVDYTVDLDEGMVVLDVIHRIQAEHAPDLSCRWNCKAGKCGSCSAEVNGKPRLMCMTRMEDIVAENPDGEPILVRPMQAFPLTKDLVTDTSWAYETDRRIVPINGPEEPDWEFYQEEADRLQEFRSCIECMLCVNTCHVLREHQMFDEFAGPRFFVRLAGLEMHPLDTGNRIPHIKDDFGIGYCNITKCCTEVCPAGIKITDNAIIPLKERVVTEFYDPLAIMARMLGIKEKLPEPSPRLHFGDANVKVAEKALRKERSRAEEARKQERARVERVRGKR